MKQIQESVLDDILVAHAMQIRSDLQEAGFKFIDEDDIQTVESGILNALDTEIRENILVEGQLIFER